MNFGIELFLEIMKGIYPSPQAFTENLKEFYQQAGQNLFAQMAGKTMGESAEVFFKSWMDSIQQAFTTGESAIDSEIQNKMMQSIIQHGTLYINFMSMVLEATRAAYSSDDSEEKLDEIQNKISQHVLDAYQQSVGKYLAAPQFGIPREALQQLNSAISAYHKFMGAAGDFLVMFSKPLKKSMEILQTALEEKERTDDGFHSAKEVYNFAVKIFDKEYDDWLKSPEGVQSVANIVEHYLEYKQNLNPVRDTWFKSLSIPTKSEMEDVYRGLYDLKKRARQQDAVIREQTDTIKNLNRKIRKLEVALSDSLPARETATSRKT